MKQISFAAIALSVLTTFTLPLHAQTGASFEPSLCTDLATPETVASVRAGLDLYVAQPGQIGEEISCSIEVDPVHGAIGVVREAFSGRYDELFLEHRPNALLLLIADGNGGTFPSGSCRAANVQGRPDVAVMCETSIIFHRGVFYFGFLSEEGRALDTMVLIQSGTDGGIEPGVGADRFRSVLPSMRAVEISVPDLDLAWQTSVYSNGEGHILRHPGNVSALIEAVRLSTADLHLSFESVWPSGQRDHHGEVIVPSNLIGSATTEFQLLLATMQGNLAEFIR